MKKAYEKPMLLAESFALVEHVAAGCKTGDGANATYLDADACVYYSDDISVFTSSSCNLDWIDDDDDSINKNNPSTWSNLLDSICYNAFVDGLSSAFAS